MFKIYNASAGSGKTYTLVKDYLSIVLSSAAYLPHRHVLAMTFTNKAVDEMKQRIVSALLRFSEDSILNSPDDLFLDLVSSLQIEPRALHLKSKEILQKILHHYGSFEVSTIDKFNQKLIRTFAYDLDLPMNFEVELDTDLLLETAVDNLISKVGQDTKLSKLLVEYAVMKSDEDLSWDIALDLYKTAKLLTNELDLPFLKTVFKNDLKSFEDFQSNINKTQTVLEQDIVKVSQSILDQISASGLEFSDFSKSSLPKYFLALSSRNFDVNLEAAWQNTIESTPLYPKKTAPIAKAKIDELQPVIAEAFNSTKQGLFQIRYLSRLQKNIIPISVLSSIQNELDQIKKERNLLLISEFNSLIAEEIKAQPAPFIYERIGEKFDCYFIDEFQDTSELQWQNITPLLVNALSELRGQVMIVGDAKQAIYRWRGGHPEQFMALSDNTSAFPIPAKVKDLPKNYRSCQQIVQFNNLLFEYISKCFFSNQSHQKLYQKSGQTPHITTGGYVQISFLEFGPGEDKQERYAEKVFQTINEIKATNPSVTDGQICVLVRKRKQGVAVANYLISKQMKVISNETLLVCSSPEVQLIIHVLKYIQSASDNIAKLNIINDLIRRHNIQNQHEFRLNHLSLDDSDFFAALQAYGVNFNLHIVSQYSLYDSVEYILQSFNLAESSDAFIQFFLDFVFEFSQKEDNSRVQFLAHYEQHKDRLSIQFPEQTEAIQISTIHKSKGLEFPIVIFPFADVDIYKEIEPKEWMPTAHLNPNFPYFLINYSKEFEHYGQEAKTRFESHQSKLQLDNINLMYVALTRAADQLYIISDASKGLKSPDKFRTFSDLFIGFLDQDNQWAPNILEYRFGTPNAPRRKQHSSLSTVRQTPYLVLSKEDQNKNLVTSKNHLWSHQQKAAIERGNLLHLLLSQISTSKDIKTSIEKAKLEGLFSPSDTNDLIKTLESITNHPDIKPYYDAELESYNEKEIITETGKVVIPDRLVIMPNRTAIIIDYKTGEQHDHYLQQLNIYANTVLQMGFDVKKKILVYIYPELRVKIYE